MKKEELISSVIMCIVSVLVLVGFTIAWFTTGGSAVVTGLQVVAGEMSAVKISTTSGGVDIESENALFLERFATFGMPDYINVEEDVIETTAVKNENGIIETNVEVKARELGPGTSGEITFYVTPASGNVTFCDVSPMIAVTEDDEKWFTAENIAEGASTDLQEAYVIAKEHIRFYRATMDENGEIVKDGDGNPVLEEITDSSAPTRLSWEAIDTNSKNQTELSVTFYWKWDYEYVFPENWESDYATKLNAMPENAGLTADQIAAMVAEEKLQLIRQYDEEDMKLGNQVSGMKFQFLFVPQ